MPPQTQMQLTPIQCPGILAIDILLKQKLTLSEIQNYLKLKLHYFNHPLYCKEHELEYIKKITQNSFYSIQMLQKIH